MKIKITAEVRDLLACGLTKIDDMVIDTAIKLSKPNENGEIEAPYVVEQILSEIRECIDSYYRKIGQGKPPASAVGMSCRSP